MYVQMVPNDYGHMVSQHRCNDCGRVYTVCPPVSEETGWDSCLGVDCPSYDASRDIDSVWEGIQPWIHAQASNLGSSLSFAWLFEWTPDIKEANT